MFRKQAIAAALLMVLAAPGLALAAVEKVSVRIDGLACPFCAYNIEKRVKTLDGVDRGARVVTSVERGIATFPWKSGVVFAPEAVRKAIRQAGFTPREISVTVTGTVEVKPEHGSESLLRVVDEKVDLVVTVRQPDRADRRESWGALLALSNGTAAKVRVWVKGEVRSESAGTSLEIVLQRWAPLEFGAEVIAEVDDLACEQCSTRTMRALKELEGVIHVQADHETDRVQIWTRDESPDLSVLRDRIETLGFKVTHVHTDGAQAMESDSE